MKHVLLLTVLGLLALGQGCSRGHDTGTPGALPPSWYTLPENQKGATPTETQPDPKTDAAVRSVFQADAQALSNVAAQTDDGDTVPWHLDGMIADFTIATNGIFGALLSNGSTAVKGTWQRTSSSTATKSMLMRSKPTLIIQRNTTAADIAKQMEPAVGSVIAAGIVHKENEAAFKNSILLQGGKFLDLCQALNTVQLSNGWSVGSFELQFSVSATGQVTPLIGVGGAFNFYFDWIRSDLDTPAAPTSETPDNGLAQFAQTLSSALSDALQDAPDSIDSGLPLHIVQVGLGIGAGGDIGVAQAQGSVSGRIMFMKDATTSTSQSLSLQTQKPSFIRLIAATRKPEHLAYAARSGVPFATWGSDSVTFEIDQDKLAKGLKNAIKMGRYFAQKARDVQNDQWKLTEIETEFDISIGGDLKLATLNGQGQFLLDFDRVDP